MAQPFGIVQRVAAQESIATFLWQKLNFYVVTREPLTADQHRAIERMLPKVKSVGMFADGLGMILGRSVRVRTERPSADIRFEIGL